MDFDKRFKENLKKVEAFHGHVCGGIVMGTKMSLYAMDYLGIDPIKNKKELIVIIEIDRCMADAVQVVTGCTIGKRSLKLVNYGRFAATFYNTTTGEAIRVIDNDIQNQDKSETTEHLVERLSKTPNEELFSIRHVKLNLSESDLPGKPLNTVTCSVCGEIVKDNKHLLRNGQPICKACAEESYYEFID